MPDIKVGTCCYCGTKAALNLRGKTRHELACTTCGAPLRRLKMLPKAAVRATAPTAAPARPRPVYGTKNHHDEHQKKPKKKKKNKRLGRKLFEEIWDVVEDIFD